MDSVIRVVAMYVILMLVFRVAGRRTLSEATTFDLLLLLIISETTQEALVDDDHSMTHAFVLIVTFVGMNIGMSLIKQRSRVAERLLDGVPLVLVENGEPIRERLEKSRVDEEDILEAARETQGINEMSEIRLAVLARDGQISVVPRS